MVAVSMITSGSSWCTAPPNTGCIRVADASPRYPQLNKFQRNAAIIRVRHQQNQSTSHLFSAYLHFHVRPMRKRRQLRLLPPEALESLHANTEGFSNALTVRAGGITKI